MGIPACAAVGVPALITLVVSQPLLLRPSVSDKAQMPDRIEMERRKRINKV
jgi:hypothetical protein